MVKAILGTLMLLVSFPAAAEVSSGYSYAFGGPVVVPKSAFTRWNGNFVHMGGGGQGRLTDRFALAGEIAVLKAITNQYAITIGLGAVTPTFHIISKDSKRKFDPNRGRRSLSGGRKRRGNGDSLRWRSELLAATPVWPAI